MKIIHLGWVKLPEHYPEKGLINLRHPGRWVLNHALAQKSIGLDVEVVTLVHGAKKDYVLEVEGIKVHYLKTAHKWRHMTFYAIDQMRVARYVKKLKPDFVHAHGTEDAYGWAAQRTGLPYCITAQGLFFQIIPTLKRKPSIHEKFLKWGENVVLKRAKHVIAKSEYVRDALIEKYPHLQLELIPNTYEPTLANDIVYPKQQSLAFVGCIDDRKGVHLIAEALKIVVNEFSNVKLHIAGNNKEGSQTLYEQSVIKDLRETLGENLILHGRVPSGQLFKMLDECVAIVAPSTEEMFGNQLIEGLMRGCHGIVTDQTAMAENVRRFGNGTIVPQGDVRAIADAINEILLSSTSYEIVEESRSRIRNYMGISKVAKYHCNLYELIISNK